MSWIQIPFPVFQLKIIASNSSSQYLLAGTDGAGLFLSTDYGSSWTRKTATGLTTTTTVPGAASNSSGEYLLAGTNTSGLFLSTVQT